MYFLFVYPHMYAILILLFFILFYIFIIINIL